MTWRAHLRADPLPWLLGTDTPAVRAATLQRLLDRPADAPEVRAARAQAMTVEPIRSILAAQDPGGWWAKPGPGYGPKYRGTVWQVILLDQLGADPGHPQITRACDYVLRWCPTAAGGHPLPEWQPAGALLGFGRLDDPRVQAAIGWAALARIPAGRRSPLVRRAVDQGVAFLFSREPAVADYPMGWGNTRPSSSWFKPGFPSGYVADVLQTLEVLAALGHGRAPARSCGPPTGDGPRRCPDPSS